MGEWIKECVAVFAITTQKSCFSHCLVTSRSDMLPFFNTTWPSKIKSKRTTEFFCCCCLFVCFLINAGGTCPVLLHGYMGKWWVLGFQCAHHPNSEHCNQKVIFKEILIVIFKIKNAISLCIFKKMIKRENHNSVLKRSFIFIKML